MNCKQIMSFINFFYTCKTHVPYTLLKQLSQNAPHFDVRPIFEIGFEHRFQISRQKILLLDLPLCENGERFLIYILRLLKHYPNPISDFSLKNVFFLFLLFLEDRDVLVSKNTFGISLEIEGERIINIKIYFTPIQKIAFMLKQKGHYLFSRLEKFPNWILHNTSSKGFGIDFAAKRTKPSIKLYEEFFTDNQTQRNEFFEILLRTRISSCTETEIKKLAIFIGMLIKRYPEIEKIGLRFRETDVSKNIAKLYLAVEDGSVKKDVARLIYNKFLTTDTKKWIHEIQKMVIQSKAHYRYICFGQDGLELYFR